MLRLEGYINSTPNIITQKRYKNLPDIPSRENKILDAELHILTWNVAVTDQMLQLVSTEAGLPASHSATKKITELTQT